MTADGGCARMLPIPQTPLTDCESWFINVSNVDLSWLNVHFLSREGIHQSHCDSPLPVGVLPAIKSSVEPIRAPASETPGPLGCRATPDGRESAYSSPPWSPPPSPPPSPPLPPCRPEAQSPGSSPPPTLDDPVTRETTPSLLSSEETGDELSVLICKYWVLLNDSVGQVNNYNNSIVVNSQNMLWEKYTS